MAAEMNKIDRRIFLAGTGSVLAMQLFEAGCQKAGSSKEKTGVSSSGTSVQETPLPFGEVAHLGWIVRDLHKTIEYWNKVGLGSVAVDDSHKISGTNYRGKQIDLVVRQGWTTIGGVGIEMFEPFKGRSVYDEFLEKHGEGVHHVAFAQESEEALEERLTALASRGIGVVQRGTFQSREGQGVFVYLDTEPTGGVCLELVYDPNYNKRKRQGSTPPAEDHRYPFGEIIQYALVVRDVDEVAEYYRKIGFEIRSIDRDNRGLIRRYRGEEEDLRMHMGWSSFGGVTLEIIQPTKGRSIYHEFLRKHFEGFHHIAFRVEDMDEAVALFRERGVEVSQDGAWGKKEVEGRFAYIDTEPVGGLTLELLWS